MTGRCEALGRAKSEQTIVCRPRTGDESGIDVIRWFKDDDVPRESILRPFEADIP